MGHYVIVTILIVAFILLSNYKRKNEEKEFVEKVANAVVKLLLEFRSNNTTDNKNK